MTTLNLGCGKKLIKGATNLDMMPPADVLHDLNNYPYPFKDNTFDTIIAENILEHLHEPMNCLIEMKRILKPGGKIKIIVPYFNSISHLHHIDHKQGFIGLSFLELKEDKNKPYYYVFKLKIR